MDHDCHHRISFPWVVSIVSQNNKLVIALGAVVGYEPASIPITVSALGDQPAS